MTSAVATVDRIPDGSDDGMRLFGTADDGTLLPEVNGDGRYVVFHSEQGFVVPGDTNGFSDVFMRDRTEGTLEVLSKPSSGQSNGDSSFADISNDGRFVVFHSEATNLVAGSDTNNSWDIFLLDRQTGTLERVSVDENGNQADGSSFHASVSDDGRYVAFHSLATNLHPTDNDTDADIFVKDRQTGEVDLISQTPTFGAVDGRSFVPDISGDGRYVAYESEATNLVGNDTNDKWDIFVYDRDGNTTERISLSAELQNADDNSFLPKISNDGRYIAFESFAENLIFGDTNGVADVYLYDRQLVQTTRVSVPFGVGDDSNDRSLGVALSDDGTQIAFQSWASNLVPGDTNDVLDVFYFEVGDTAPTRMSQNDGTGGNGPSALPAMAGDGSIVVFESLASNLGDAADTDGFWDAFIYDTTSGDLAAASPIGELAAEDVFTISPFLESEFDDVPEGTWYTRGVGFLKANGITTGTSATTFSPGTALTRGQMVTFLFRLAGSQWTDQDENFDDVWGGTYFYEPVKWAYANDITNGTSATTFSPDGIVNRAQMAVFLWRLAGEPEVVTPHGFTDVPEGSFYDAAVRWLKDSGITTGTSETTYSPGAAVTRAQLAAFAFRLVDEYGWTPTWVPPA
ncbi:MAG: S-layer homology domain-containing protein [Actinomycetota bacterium]